VSDLEALQRAVERNPDEDVTKRAFADCLTDNGMDKQAAAVLRKLDERPVELTDEQNHVVRALIADTKRVPVQTLGGFAGTGKTTVARTLAERLPKWGVVAFTGKAVDMLRRKGIRGPTTIHQAIYDTQEVNGGLIHTRRAYVTVEGFLIDEASMVAADLLQDLRSYNVPIIAIGDHGQLPPVGDDAGLMKEPMFKLETVHRNAGPIAHFAEHLRHGKRAKDWPNGDGVWIGPKKSIPNRTLMGADQIICAFNKTRVAMNRRVREMLKMQPEHSLFSKGLKDRPEIGDRIICLKNSRKERVFNGQQGIVGMVNHREGRLLFQPDFGGPLDQKYVAYHPDCWNALKPPKHDQGSSRDERVPFDFGYCVTAHKFQGDEAERVVCFEETCDLWEAARWNYTAASRARSAVVWAL
jgi:exodeoxyribonuclease-5